MKKIIAGFLALIVIFTGMICFSSYDSQNDLYLVANGESAQQLIATLENDVNTSVALANEAAKEELSTDVTQSLFGYVIATEYVSADGVTDVADDIQAIIDANPNRTIYFPDGVYLISKPICTPADPTKSVDLQLSNYAVIKAAGNFEGEALIRSGGKDSANDTHTVGSNYSVTGGVLDGSGITNGITIESGRETAIRDMSIKNTVVGISILYGANSGSSDADIRDVNIIGTGTTDSVGVYVEGHDNTFTNMRIGNVFIGVHLNSSANSLRNIHPLYYSDYTDYENSYGFLDEGGNNVYDFCYSDQFCNGFGTNSSISSVFDNCYCFWYSEAGGKEVAFKADEKFNSVVTNFRASFRDDTENAMLKIGKIGGSGVFTNLLVNKNSVSDSTYKTYKQGNIIYFFKSLFN